jgi:hypothetical protein
MDCARRNTEPRINAERLRKLLASIRAKTKELYPLMTRATTESWMSRFERELLEDTFIRTMQIPAFRQGVEALGLRCVHGPVNVYLRAFPYQFAALVDENGQYTGVAKREDYEGYEHDDVKFAIVFDWDSAYDPQSADPWDGIARRAEEVVNEYRARSGGAHGSPVEAGAQPSGATSESPKSEQSDDR